MSTKLFLTESGFFFITKDVPDNGENHPFNQIDYAQFKKLPKDNPNIYYDLTELLNTEFPPQSFPFRRRTFKNGLNRFPDLPPVENYTALFEYKPVSDDDYLLMIRKLGYTIEKDIRDIYVDFDELGYTSYFDKDKNELFSNDDYLGTNAYVQSQNLFMNFNMPRYLFKKEDYQRYQEIEKQKQKDPASLNNLSLRDENLYLTIQYCLSRQKNYLLTITHESKHQKNRFLRERRQLKADAKKLSCEDIYKINVEDERSAKFSEILEAVNNYFKTGKDDLLNICKEENRWLKDALEGKSPEEIKTILSDHSFLLNACLKDWNTNFAPLYYDQFSYNCPEDAKHYLTLPDNVNHEEYNKQRSLYYSFEVYNPETGKTETKDFSKLMTVDVTIGNEEQNIIQKSERERKITGSVFLDPQTKKTLLGIIQQAKEMLKEKIRVMDNLEETRLDEHQTEKDSSETNIKPQPEIKQEPKGKPQPEPKALPKPKTKPKPKISVEENISEPKEKTPPENKPHNKDFAEPYRKFYKNVAKQENSTYSEDENSPYYNATLTRKNGEELNIVATPENRISLGSKDKDKKPKIPDYKDFNDLALLAKKTGQKIIFGNIKSPEFKARLMLACLENGIEMNNLPNFSELKGIEPETMERLKKKLKEQTPADKQSNNQKETQEKRSKIEHHRDTVRQQQKQAAENRKVIQNPRFLLKQAERQ